MNERDEHGRLVEATVRLIRDADAPERVHADARGWFEALDVAPEHVEACVAIGAKRLLLYRKLVRNGLRTAIRNLMPRTAARLAASFEVWVERYCEKEMPQSHYLRDVAHEFLLWVLPQWKSEPSVPRYLSDLARFELFEFHVATAVKEERPISGRELMLDKPVVFDASVRIAQFDHAVQRLSEDEADREVPVDERIVLLGYRDAAHDVQVLELNALAAGILERLWTGETLGEAVTKAFGGVPPPPVLETIAQLLADLADKNVLLGAG
jgi:hypothetical protein